jgi:LPXTG-motif cell wall-anchored protein
MGCRLKIVSWARPHALRIAVVVAFSVVAIPVGALSPAVLAAPGTSCVNEQYEWRGRVTISAGASFATGVQVPTVAGTEVILVGSSSSADPFATSFVNVLVGGQVALEEAVVAGGELTAMNIGTDSLELTTVGVSVQRCHQVAQAATPVGPDLSRPLPDTGTNTFLSLVAALSTSTGVLLIWISRRRSRSSFRLSARSAGHHP